MHALMVVKVEGVQRSAREGSHVTAELFAVVSECEDTAIMRVVSVTVSQRVAGAGTQFVKEIESSSLGDIDDTLEQEGRLVKIAVKEAHPATFAKQAATFALALTTPHAVVDVIVECVHETLTCNGTRDTDSLSDDDAHTVAGKEGLCWILATLTVGHPFGTHTYLPSLLPLPLLLHSQ
jgi:hypothetical protein